MRYTIEHIAFADYYSQLAASTAYTGNSDTLFGKFVNFRRCLTQGFWARPILDKLVQCRVPLAVIWGESDDLFPSKLASIIKQARPDSKTYVLDDSLHNPAHNNATDFVTAIKREIVRHIRPKQLSSKRKELTGEQSPDINEKTKAFTNRKMRSHTVGANLPSLSEIRQLSDITDSKEEDSCSRSTASTYSNIEPEVYEHRRPRAFSAGPTCRADLDLASWSSDSSFKSPSRSEANRALIAFTGRSFSLSRGVCTGCGQRVQLVGPYFQCGCGAWMFYYHINESDSQKEFKRMIAFLQELYGYQSFDATRSKNIASHNWVPSSKRDRAYKPQYPNLVGFV